MTTAVKTLVCLHDARGVCWACSDQDPRWREWRGGGDPPNARQAPVPLPVIEDAPDLSSIETARHWYQRMFGRGRKG